MNEDNAMQQAIRQYSQWTRTPNRRRQIAAPGKHSRSPGSRDQEELLDEVYREEEEGRSDFRNQHDDAAEKYADERPSTEMEALTSEENLSADDTLAVYLKQMGAVPLLSRAEELELTQRLDHLRRRYRHAALWNWSVLAQLVETFERIRAGQLSLDRSIDVVPSQGLDAGRVRGRLPRHLAALRRLVDQAKGGFLRMAAARSIAARRRLRREHWRRLRRAAALAEQLSPRTEFLDLWTENLKQQAAQIHDLLAPADPKRSPLALKAEGSANEQPLRILLLQVKALPEELSGLLRVLARRRALYQRARSDLAQANLRLVVSIAKRYRGHGLPFADLIQEGNSGLMRAVDKFDYRLGYKFGTYATWWIRQGVQRALSDTARTVRVPCHQVALLGAIDRVRGELLAKQGYEPTMEQIAAALKITPQEATALRVAGRHPVSLNETFDGGDEHSMQDFLYDMHVANPSQTADHHLLKERLAEVLSSLAPRDREVIELRFGLRDGRARSLDELATHFGVTRERIRQIEARGLSKLRQDDRRQRLAGFVDVA
jgi:RNA polymerase primary sigma factor